MLNEIELSELICAKFCHDLAGPIGAINNGIEFLQEENSQMKEKAFQLIEISAKQSVARLQFFRHLYGTVSGLGEANLLELKQLAINFLGRTKSSLDWPDENVNMSGVVIGNNLAKIILHFISISNNILIYGGKISIRLAKTDNDKIIQIKATGANIKIDDDSLMILSNQSENINITTKNVQYYLINRLVQIHNLLLDIDKKQEEIVFLMKKV